MYEIGKLLVARLPGRYMDNVGTTDQMTSEYLKTVSSTIGMPEAMLAHVDGPKLCNDIAGKPEMLVLTSNGGMRHIPINTSNLNRTL